MNIVNEINKEALCLAKENLQTEKLNLSYEKKNNLKMKIEIQTYRELVDNLITQKEVLKKRYESKFLTNTFIIHVLSSHVISLVKLLFINTHG